MCTRRVHGWGDGWGGRRATLDSLRKTGETDEVAGLKTQRARDPTPAQQVSARRAIILRRLHLRAVLLTVWHDHRHEIAFCQLRLQNFKHH